LHPSLYPGIVKFFFIFKMRFSPALVLPALALAAPAPELEERACAPIHIFGARETTAPAGYGTTQNIVNSLISAHSGATGEAVVSHGFISPPRPIFSPSKHSITNFLERTILHAVVSLAVGVFLTPSPRKQEPPTSRARSTHTFLPVRIPRLSSWATAKVDRSLIKLTAVVDFLLRHTNLSKPSFSWAHRLMSTASLTMSVLVPLKA